MRSLPYLVVTLLTLCPGLLACGPGGDANNPSRTPLADKWLARAQNSYRQGDFEDAQHAGKAALEVAPKDHDIRLINARKRTFASALTAASSKVASAIASSVCPVTSG